MAAQGTDLTIISRGGTIYNLPLSEIAALGGGGSSAGFTDLTAAAPANPAADTVRLFRKSFGHRHLPAFKGIGGQDSALQESLHGNAIFYMSPASGATVPNCIGGTLSAAATMSMPALAVTSRWTGIQRKRWQTATTAASLSGMRTAYTQWTRGTRQGDGGWFWRSRFGQQLNRTGSHAFHGLCGSAAALPATAGAVSALINSIGVGYDTTDPNTGNWFLYRNDGSGTALKVDLGGLAARSQVTDGFELVMFCLPHNGVAAQNIWVEITRVSDGAVILPATEFTTDLPANTAFLAMKTEISNGAVAAAMNIEVAHLYIGSDF